MHERGGHQSVCGEAGTLVTPSVLAEVMTHCCGFLHLAPQILFEMIVYVVCGAVRLQCDRSDFSSASCMCRKFTGYAMEDFSCTGECMRFQVLVPSCH